MANKSPGATTTSSGTAGTNVPPGPSNSASDLVQSSTTTIVYVDETSTISGIPTTYYGVASTKTVPVRSTPSTTTIKTSSSGGTTTTQNTLPGSAPTTTSTSSSQNIAVPNASSTNSTAPAISSGNGGKYSTGALAGGIVGAALGAAIITFLATFLLCKRKNRRASEDRRAYQGDGAQWRSYDKGEMAVAEKPASESNGMVGLGWQAYLPQALDDRSVQNAVKTLFNQIELHVDNYYHKAQVNIDDSVKADLAPLDSSKLPAPLADLISEPGSVMPLIKHCIGNLLIARITPGDNTARSLLPARYASAPAKLGSSTVQSTERSAAQQAYSQWKILSAFLFPRAQDEATDGRRLQSVNKEIAESIYLAFMPWQADMKNGDALKQHESSLITRATDLGILIHSQSSAYQFDWSDGVGAGRMVVLPSFLKTSDERGRALENVQVMVKATVARLQ